jgi:hypothetical protein
MKCNHVLFLRCSRAPGLGGWETMFKQVEDTWMQAELYGDLVGPDLPAQIQHNRVERRRRDLSSPISVWKEVSWKS